MYCKSIEFEMVPITGVGDFIQPKLESNEISIVSATMAGVNTMYFVVNLFLFFSQNLLIIFLKCYYRKLKLKQKIEELESRINNLEIELNKPADR